MVNVTGPCGGVNSKNAGQIGQFGAVEMWLRQTVPALGRCEQRRCGALRLPGRRRTVGLGRGLLRRLAVRQSVFYAPSVQRRLALFLLSKRVVVTVLPAAADQWRLQQRDRHGRVGLHRSSSGSWQNQHGSAGMGQSRSHLIPYWAESPPATVEPAPGWLATRIQSHALVLFGDFCSCCGRLYCL